MNTCDGRRATILIVEDIDWIRSSMRSSVRLLGYLAAEAAGDDEAIEIAEADPPDLILTEEDLPTFDSLLSRLGEHPSLHEIPVVIINPDADENTHYGDAIILNDYEELPSLLLRRINTHDDK